MPFMSTDTTNAVPCQIKRLEGNTDTPLPAYQSEHAAGMETEEGEVIEFIEEDDFTEAEQGGESRE